MVRPKAFKTKTKTDIDWSEINLVVSSPLRNLTSFSKRQYGWQTKRNFWT